ncbi:MAG: arginine--tRNA ligase [Actinomycetota bacterium]
MRDHVRQLSLAAVKQAVEDKKLRLKSQPGVEVERPRDKAHGDWSTNVALTLAKTAGLKPADIADVLIPYLREESTVFASVEFAAPGFINFRLAPVYLASTLLDIERLGPDFGRSDLGGGEKVQVEFVSANPTGPLHVGHGRWAAVGDALAAVMAAAGWQVEREFYVNDFGTQMDLFGISVAARYAQLLGLDEPVPEGGYHGAYVTEIAQEIIDDEGEKYLNYPPEERHAVFRKHAEEVVIEHIKRVLTTFGVKFDVWFSERTLHASGALDKTISQLREQGHVYDLDGAVWLKTTAFGDDKDRVLIRENGQPTYLPRISLITRTSSPVVSTA